MINYGIIQVSIEYYTNLGFQRIETPWMVSEYTDSLTRPEGVKPFTIEINKKNLVASGEQSFLELHLKRYLPNGKYQTTTPCFRAEPRDNLHCKTFIKNELIITDDVNDKKLADMIENTLSFFKIYIPDAKVVETKIGFDIEVDGQELGSYGIREFDGFKYIYGTGCAEPRLSRLMNKYGRK